MRIAHRKPAEGLSLPLYRRPGKRGGASHYDGDGALRAVPQDAQPRGGLQSQRLVVDPAAVPGVAGGAAGGVAAHFGFGPVRIKDPHPQIGPFGVLQQHQSVAAHAPVPVADLDGQRSGVGDRPAAAVDKDVVVARAVHFKKINHWFYPPFSTTYVWGKSGKLAIVFERNVKFPQDGKKYEKPLDFFGKMITIVFRLALKEQEC